MNAYSMDYWAFFYKKTDPHTGTFRLRLKCEATGRRGERQNWPQQHDVLRRGQKKIKKKMRQQ